MKHLIKAPSVNEIIIDKLSANYAQLSWDDVGRNFHYLLEYKNITDSGEWEFIGHLSDNKITLDIFEAGKDYQIRIGVGSRGFEQSDWTYTEVFKTFMYNLYTFDTMDEFILSDRFIDEKFIDNNKGYINFDNDVVLASLMRSGFRYHSNIHHVSYISDSILKRAEYHEVLGNISHLCKDDKRVMVGYIDDVLYMVERYQKLAKLSNDKGQTWQLVDLFDGRVGNPITNTVFSQNSTTTYALGYNHIFYGRPSSNIRWSSIKERFSQTDVTFTRLDDSLGLGYEIEVFNRFARYPEELNDGKAEAFVATDRYVFVAGNGVIRFVDNDEPVFDEEPTSPTFGERIFSEEVIEVGDEDIVIKKMDAIGDDILFLVSGKLKEGKLDKRNPDNIEPCDCMGVYKLNIDDYSIERVFGNTEEERYYINHKYTNLSTNGREFFINYIDYRYDEIVEWEDSIELDEGEDPVDLILTKFKRTNGYLNTPKPLMGSWRTTPKDLTKWEMGFMKYYNEADFTYMARSNNRVFITTEKRIGIVHGKREYTYPIEPEGPNGEKRILGEEWKDGEVTIYSPDVHFEDFNQYSSGILLYKNTGEIIGYFEFQVDSITEVDIIWKPQNVLLKATLIGQVADIIEEEIKLKRLEDPNLVPFIPKMIPDNYFRDSDIEESRYYQFIKNYIEYLSDPRDSTYKAVLNVNRNKYPFEVDSLNYLWEEAYKRNIYLDKEKKEETIKFFMSRKHDFYSSKGTIESYKFLFRLLYNEDVEIDDETDIMNYYITADMKHIDERIIGNVLYTKTGRCHITNIERVYIDGKKRWHLTITDMIGNVYKGQEIKSEDGRYVGIIEADIKGKEYLYDDIDYINRGQSYYVMRIKSKLPVSRYRDDVIRFVHPLGIGFKGIVDITLFMNAGLNFRHMETIIEKYVALKFDGGVPTHYPTKMRKIDGNGKEEFDDYTGEPKYVEHPRNGELMDIDVDEYNKENELTPEEIENIDDEYRREYVETQTPDQRRKKFTPLFDSSVTTFSKYLSLVNSFIENSDKYRLKDNNNLPRDPEEPTQRKLTEDEI